MAAGKGDVVSISTDKSSALYTGNGAGRSFPFDFKVWEPDQIIVTQADADGEEKDITAQATVALTETGGTVTLPAALPAGYKLAISRSMPFVQEDRYITGTRFDPHEIEDALDIACAERQELREKQERTLVVPITSEKTPGQVMDEILDTAARANEYAEKTEQLYREVVELRDNAETVIIETGDEQVERVIREGDNQIARVQAEGDTQTARASAEADRAENAADIAALTHYVSGAEDTLMLESDVPAGSIVDLPAGLKYLVGRHHLRVGYDGVIMSPSFFEEVGENGSASTQVRILFPLYQGQELDFWIIPLGEAGEILEEVRREGAAQIELATKQAENASASASAAADSEAEAARQAESSAASAGQAADTVREGLAALELKGTEQKAIVESAGAKQVTAVEEAGALQIEAATAQAQAAADSAHAAAASSDRALEQAEAATQKAGEAAASASASASSALMSSEKASDAAGSAAASESSATTAQTAATTATDKAGEAASSATAAESSAADAQTAAATATQKASDAASSANAAAVSAQVAQDAMTKVYRFRGSVETYDDLPTENLSEGDVYDVKQTDINYAWTGTKWDALGGRTSIVTDSQPTEGSPNPVSSGGVYTAIAASTVQPATTAPKAPGNASTGSENRYARSDHVHPLQTSVSGNAATATKATQDAKGNVIDSTYATKAELGEVREEAVVIDSCLVTSLDDVPAALREGGIIILKTTV